MTPILSFLQRPLAFCRGPSYLLSSFPCQENACRRRDKDEGGQADKAPFKGVDGHPHDSGLRGAVIPTQVRAAHHRQNDGYSQDAHAHRDEPPVEGRAPQGLSPGKLQIDDLQLFRESLHLIHLRLCHCFAQQRADRRLNASDRARSRSASGTDKLAPIWKRSAAPRSA